MRCAEAWIEVSYLLHFVNRSTGDMSCFISESQRIYSWAMKMLILQLILPFQLQSTMSYVSPGYRPHVRRMLQVSPLSQSLAATAHPSDRSSPAVDSSLLDVTFPPDPQSGGHVTDMASARSWLRYGREESRRTSSSLPHDSAFGAVLSFSRRSECR